MRIVLDTPRLTFLYISGLNVLAQSPPGSFFQKVVNSGGYNITAIAIVFTQSIVSSHWSPVWIFKNLDITLKKHAYLQWLHWIDFLHGKPVTNLRVNPLRASALLLMMMMMMMIDESDDDHVKTFCASLSAQQQWRPSTHWQRAFRCPSKYHQNQLTFWPVISATLVSLSSYHLHIEMAYFLSVNNAHHWQKHNWYQRSHCQRQKLKNPKNI